MWGFDRAGYSSSCGIGPGVAGSGLGKSVETSILGVDEASHDLADPGTRQVQLDGGGLNRDVRPRLPCEGKTVV
jgi:hypothetical protein